MYNPGKGAKILIVEDDADIRQILSVFLKKSGFEVRTAMDGQEAIGVIPEFRPDLIVLDLMMQPVSGWEVLRWLRTHHEPPTTDQGNSPDPSGSNQDEMGRSLHSTFENSDPAETLNKIPVLILTALTQIEQQLEGFEAGAVEYMTKPTQPGKIVERIHKLLSYSEEQLTMLRHQRIEEQRAILERILASQPEEFF